jgi:hypothetical protein
MALHLKIRNAKYLLNLNLTNKLSTKIFVSPRIKNISHNKSLNSYKNLHILTKN